MQESIASNVEVNGSVELSNLERMASKYKDIIHQLTSENKDLKKQKEKNESALKKLSDGHSRTQSKTKYIYIQEYRSLMQTVKLKILQPLVHHELVIYKDH